MIKRIFCAKLKRSGSSNLINLVFGFSRVEARKITKSLNAVGPLIHDTARQSVVTNYHEADVELMMRLILPRALQSTYLTGNCLFLVLNHMWLTICLNGALNSSLFLCPVFSSWLKTVCLLENHGKCDQTFELTKLLAVKRLH